MPALHRPPSLPHTHRNDSREPFKPFPLDRVGELRIFWWPVVDPFTCLGIYHPPTYLVSLARARSHRRDIQTDGEGSTFMAPHAVDSRWPPICLLVPQCAGAHNNAWMSFCMQGIERGPFCHPCREAPWVTTKGNGCPPPRQGTKEWADGQCWFGLSSVACLYGEPGTRDPGPESSSGYCLSHLSIACSLLVSYRRVLVYVRAGSFLSGLGPLSIPVGATSLKRSIS